MKPRSRKVLVVDDDRALRSVLAMAIADAGYEAIEGSNGFSALRLAERERPDLILLDLALPDLTGPDVLRELRAHRSTSSIPVIVVTARPGMMPDASPELAVALMVPKPFDLDELMGHIERLFSRPRARPAPVPPFVDRRRAGEPLGPLGTWPTAHLSRTSSPTDPIPSDRHASEQD